MVAVKTSATLLWSIKLSRTTSARSVNLYATPSFQALIVQWVILQLAISVLTINGFPLIVSVCLLCLFISVLFQRKLLPTPLHGVIDLDSNQFRIGKHQYYYQRCDVSFHTWLVIFELKSGEKVCIWRDSVCDADYRHLLVMLRTQKTPSTMAGR
ncbi:protein YgfX [Vibrio xiamenensis]|uniref:protein YgfX n=1 Tax=Vibrio xiamenensis TaxID=861298 RepID=UPI003CCC32B1